MNRSSSGGGKQRARCGLQHSNTHLLVLGLGGREERRERAGQASCGVEQAVAVALVVLHRHENLDVARELGQVGRTANTATVRASRVDVKVCKATDMVAAAPATAA